MRAFCDSFFKKCHIKPQIKMEFSSSITCYHMASTGMGLAMIPYLITRLTHCDQDMELFSLGQPPVTWTVQALYRKDAYLGSRNRILSRLPKGCSAERRFFPAECLTGH